MNAKDNVVSRWRPEWHQRPELARLGREFLKVVSFLEEVPAKRGELAKGGRLSAKGLNDAARDFFAANVVPDLRRAAWEVELTVNDIAGRRGRLCQIEIDKTDFAGALVRQEVRARLRAMSQGEVINALLSSAQIQAAAFEGPAMLSGLSEETLYELKHRILLEQRPKEAAALIEAEKAVAVANAAINLVAGSLQIAAGFEGDDHTFASWMTISSAAVEKEIAAARTKPDQKPASGGPVWDQLKADIGHDIDRMFAEAFPTIFRAAA